MTLTQNGVLKKDDNGYPVMGGVDSIDLTTIRNSRINSSGRLLADFAGGGSGTVTDVSVVSANGFAGSVANSTTTPAITISTTINAPVLKGNGTAISAATTTGSGSTVVLNNTPTLITPVIGAATGTSLTVSGNLYSQAALVLEETGAGTDTVTIQVASSIAASYTLTLPVDDGTANQFLQTDGSGVLTWATGSAGTVTAVSIATANGFSGSSSGGATPALTIVAGAIVPTSVNGLTITTTTGTFTLTNAKTFAVAKSLTLDGTDSTTMTFPSTSATIARTDAANTFTGASTTSAWVMTSPTITTKISPTTDDGAPLGDTTHNFSDLFLATGAVINYQNSNVVITHTSGILTMGTGELRITTPGSNSASVPTLGSTSTLTNKTLTAPTIGGAAVVADAATVAFTVPTVDGTATGDITTQFNSGYSSTAVGDLVYLDSSATWQKADADASATTYSSGPLGIALSVTASGAAATVLLRGYVYAATPFPTFTIGGPIYMSATAGAVTQTAPTSTDSATRLVGYGIHADKMWFNPSNDWITHT